MLLRRLYDDTLAQAAWLVVDRGEAVVIDPNRDVSAVVEAAARERARIVGVTETHIHADFVSGSRELAKRTGAAVYLSDEGDAYWKYAWAADDGATLIREGDAIRVGAVRLDVLHTPGHTPEHVSFLLTDTAASDQPMGIFTGDFLFVGDVGRPDLLETAAKQAGAADAGARALFRSVRRLVGMPDWLQIWPGHGAGSACGKGIGAMPQSTLGYEKIANPVLSIADEDAFVRAVLSGLTDPPPYFAHMKRINKEGPAPFAGRFRPERVAVGRLEDARRRGAIVLDARPAGAFAAGHLPGTINIPFDRSFLTWVGWLVPIDAEVMLIIDARAGGGIDEIVRDLGKIGVERIAGWTGANAFEAWGSAGQPLERTDRIDVAELRGLHARDGVPIIDVRTRAEWTAGHIPGVPNIPLGELPRRMAQVPRDGGVAVHCQTGHRAMIAASLLQAAGIPGVRMVTGGFAEWERSGLEVEREGAGRETGVASGA